MRKTGSYKSLGEINYFIPFALPPENPPLDLNSEIMALYSDCMFQFGKLNEAAIRLSEIKHFIKAYVVKEALLSCAIEGINTTLFEIYTQPLLESKPNKDTQLVLNYTKALDVALDMIQKDGLPIVSRVILEAHRALMQLGDGDKASPGQYRKQSVHVGNLVPPPAFEIPRLMSELEQYINNDATFPPLIKAGLAHVQFEIIHPFLDGNGRIGRLLIILILIENKIIEMPIIYPSYYFKKNHYEYYKHLEAVSQKGDFEGWIKFYLTAIRESTLDAYRRAKGIESLKKQLTELILQDKQFHKMRDTAQDALDVLFTYPLININTLSIQLAKSYNTAKKLIENFLVCGILVPETEQKRGKIFRFKKYWDILERE